MWAVHEDNVGKLIGQPHNTFRICTRPRKELEKILQLARTLILHESLRPPSLRGVPTEMGLATSEFDLLLVENILPCFVYERLV